MITYEPLWKTMKEKQVSQYRLITKYGVTTRVITIVSVALGVGYGLGATAGAISGLGSNINLVFGGSGIVPAALLATLLNLLIPMDKEDEAAQEAAAHMAELKAKKLAEKSLTANLYECF